MAQVLLYSTRNTPASCCCCADAAAYPAHRLLKEPPMSVSMYRLSVPVLLRGLDVLQHYVDLAERHARDKDLDPCRRWSTRAWRRTCSA